jgi:hypothetical protein
MVPPMLGQYGLRCWVLHARHAALRPCAAPCPHPREAASSASALAAAPGRGFAPRALLPRRPHREPISCSPSGRPTKRGRARRRLPKPAPCRSGARPKCGSATTTKATRRRLPGSKRHRGLLLAAKGGRRGCSAEACRRRCLAAAAKAKGRGGCAGGGAAARTKASECGAGAGSCSGGRAGEGGCISFGGGIAARVLGRQLPGRCAAWLMSQLLWHQPTPGHPHTLTCAKGPRVAASAAASKTALAASKHACVQGGAQAGTQHG